MILASRSVGIHIVFSGNLYNEVLEVVLEVLFSIKFSVLIIISPSQNWN